MARSPEYNAWVVSPQWRAKSRRYCRSTQNTCVLFPWRTATHSHHLTYRNLTRELLIRDCVPLSREAHRLIHCHLLWQTGLRQPTNWILRGLCLLWLGGGVGMTGVSLFIIFACFWFKH